MTESQRIISVTVENLPGVLARVSGMFSGRGFNIHSLTVAPTLDTNFSRMTIVTEGSEQITEQIIKQLRKLVNVLKVQDISTVDHVERETALIKISAAQETRAEVLRITDIFRARVVDVTHETLTVEVSGASGKLEAILELLKPIGVQELVRTGVVAIPRARKS
jgi:acetolactate synthase-1/3 small subunit